MAHAINAFGQAHRSNIKRTPATFVTEAFFLSNKQLSLFDRCELANHKCI